MTLEDLLSKFGIPFKRPGEHHHTTGNRIQIDCPWCSPGTQRFRMGIHTRFFNCACWTCGPHKFLTTLAELTKKTIQSLALEVGQLDWTEFNRAIYERNLTGGVLRPPEGVGPFWPKHVEYLKSRGFKPADMIRLWRVQGIGPEGGKFVWRLYIPVVLNGQVVSWTTRSVSDKVKPKYVSAAPDEEKLPHKSLLYGEDYCRHSVVVCEGPTDVWRVGPGAVATFGVGIKRSATDEQTARILKYPVRIVCFDNEPDAQRRARELVTRLSIFNGKTYNVTLDAPDPGSAPEREVKKLRRFAFGE